MNWLGQQKHAAKKGATIVRHSRRQRALFPPSLPILASTVFLQQRRLKLLLILHRPVNALHHPAASPLATYVSLGTFKSIRLCNPRGSDCQPHHQAAKYGLDNLLLQTSGRHSLTLTTTHAHPHLILPSIQPAHLFHRYPHPDAVSRSD